jgi:hypothetical protein
MHRRAATGIAKLTRAATADRSREDVFGIKAETGDHGSLWTAALAAPERPLMPGDFQALNFVFEFEFFLLEPTDR